MRKLDRTQKKFDCHVYKRQYFKTKDVIEQIKDSISKDEYCYTYINEAKIVNIPDNCHDVIIIGYNELESYITILGYYNELYQKIHVPYDVFRASFYSGIEYSYKVGNVEDKHFRTFRWKMYPTQQYSINLDKMKQYCHDYLNSRINDIQDYEVLEKEKEANLGTGVFGVSTFKCLVQEINAVIENGEKLDYRKFHTLYEYALLMEKRVKYLAQNISIKYKDLYPLTLTMIQTAVTLRLAVLKYNAGLNEKMRLKIIQYTETIGNQQKEIVKEIYQLLNTVEGGI